MVDIGAIISVVILFIIVIILLSLSIRIINEYQRAVIFRLGRVIGMKGPGIIFLIPIIDRPNVIDLRVNNVEVPSQTMLTKDNVTVSVDAIVYFKVIDPIKAVIAVNNYYAAVVNMAQTTLRDVIGQLDLDELLAKREEVNKRLQILLDETTEGWGVKVTAVTIRDVKISQQLLSAIAQQAEAERIRRAKIILSEGERQAASILADASNYYLNKPIAIQLRFLEMLSDIAQKGSLIVLVPTSQDLYGPLALSLSQYKSVVGGKQESGEKQD